MNKSLLSNAVVVWNAVHVENIVARLRADGEDIQEERLARISPLAHQHLIPNGTYQLAKART
jgi:hypothetical protein